MSKVDWSKCGKRLRYQSDPFHNPDWNSVAERWKDEADYYADELLWPEVFDLAPCPSCDAMVGLPCLIRGQVSLCTPRKRAAGEEKLRRFGPRFGGGQ